MSTTAEEGDSQARESVQNVENFYQLGKDVPPGRGYRTGKMQKAVDKHKLNADTLRKSRNFADPKVGYSPEELQDLIEHIRSHKFDRDNPKWKITRTHLIRLISVPKKDGKRLALQRRLIDEEWSCSQLEDQIRLRFCTKQDRGRRRQVAQDPLSLLAQITHECDRWTRWINRLNEDGKASVALRQLPRSVQRNIRQISTLVKQLGAEANKAGERQARH